MTLIIGLSTSAYSSGIGSMTKEFGVATVAGQGTYSSLLRGCLKNSTIS
jgi:hypothetical protein